MNPIAAAVLGATILLVAAAAPARAQSPQVPNASQVTEAPYVPVSPWPKYPAPPSLFTIAGTPAYLWAPIEPPYDANNNRNLAADPLWSG